MEKIVIDAKEVAGVVSAPPDQLSRLEPKLPPPVPLWAKLAMAPLVLVLPVLCLFALVFRVAMRGLPPRTRFAWLSFLSTLLIISGLLTSIVAVGAVALVPLPAIVSSSLDELDSRSTFPSLPTAVPITGLAAKWAAQNTNLLPIDARSISPPLSDAAPVAGPNAAPEISASDGNPKETPGDPWAQKISIS